MKLTSQVARHFTGQSKTMRISTRLLSATLLAAALASCSVFSSNKKVETVLPALKEPGIAKQLWAVSIGKSGVGFAPTLVNGQLFAASQDGTVIRLNAASGQPVFRTSVGKALSAGVGSDGETAVVVARDGEVIAIGGKGEIKWRLPLRLDTTTPPAVAVGTVVVRSLDNRVVALDLETGKLRWNFQRTAPALVLRQASGVSMTSGTVFVGLTGGRLLALGINDGVPRWEASVSQSRGGNDVERIGDVVGTPLVIGREVCAVAVKGNVICVEASSGQPIWARPISSNSGLDIDPRLVVVSQDEGSLVAYNRAGGSPAWTTAALKGRDLSAPVMVGSAIAVGDQAGNLHVMARSDGAALARFNTDGSPIVSQPVANAKQVVVQTSAGGLYAYEVQ
jgi:outer membrane protein assembly factor BamB